MTIGVGISEAGFSALGAAATGLGLRVRLRSLTLPSSGRGLLDGRKDKVNMCPVCPLCVNVAFKGFLWKQCFIICSNFR